MAIRIDIASEFKDKGFKQADKATTSLQRNLKSLGKTLVGVLSVREVVQFGKASVRAFEEDERAATRLTQTLGNLGLAFEDSRVTAYIADLERASGVLDDKLRPAFQSLLTTTGSVTKAQDLLGLALDVAAGSGQDVTTVAGDLSKAYVGNTRSLAKYNTGLSRAELQTANFAEVQALLAKQFSGQNAAYLDTYSGKVAVLNIAYANMQETVFEFFRNVDPFAPWSAITQMGKVKPKPFQTPMSVSGSTDAQVKIDRARAKAESDAAKRAKELLALTKKQVKSQEALNKKKKEEGILGQIAQRFDLERVQIAAALRGQIDDVERLRLELMQAILDEDVKRAIILEGQLIKAEAAAKELADLLDSLDEMVGDPFVDWPSKITRIQELLKQLNIKIPIETLFAEKGLRLDQSTMSVTKLERMDVDANNVYINGQLMNQNQTMVNTGQALSAEVWKEFTADNPLVVAAVENAAEANLALADAELLLAESLLAESDGTIEINVNVDGSIISEGDLAETIINEIYRNQRNGTGIFLSSVAI